MKTLFYGLLPMLMMAGTEAMAQCEVKVDLKDMTNQTIVVQLIDKDFHGPEKNDTLQVKKGKFTYSITDDKARMAVCVAETADGKKPLTFYMVPGEKGVLKGTVADAQWSGTAFYQEMAELEAATKPLQKQMDELMEDYQKKTAAGARADSLQKIINPIYSDLNHKMIHAKEDFVKAHPASEVNITVLPGLHNPEKSMETMKEAIDKGRFTYFVDFTRNKIEAEKRQKEAAKAVADGKMAPEFTLKSIDGTDLALSSLRGKYLILDFWGSWCGWCIKGFPDLKKYYEKYKDRMEILGVDCNDTEEKWKAAVEKYELKWKHVYNPKNSDVLKKYAVTGFPTKLVIDPEGKIIKTVVGENPAFYNYLDELFQ